jgi:septal ring factor EnvC (AmiA/AmiB activator)
MNNEINLICKWIDTYMGDNYDKNYDIPSLINEEINFFSDIHDSNNLNLKLNNYLQFDLLKKSLEKSRNKINNILNQNERKLIEYKTLLKEMKIKNSELKGEINQLNNEITNLKDNKLKSSNNNQIEKQKNENKINELKEIFSKTKEENEKFLTHLYDIILKELNDILRDDTFKSFHKNILNNFDNFNNINDMLNNSVEKLIQFLQFLKYEYTKMKNENPKNLTLNSNENL